MFVGFLRTEKTPPRLAKVLALTCKNKGIDLLYFTPEDIDYKNKKINGRLLVEDQWLEIESFVPKFIDMQATLFEEKEFEKEIKFLVDHSILSVNKESMISKDILKSLLVKNKKLNKFMIPSKVTDSPKDIFNFLETHNSILIRTDSSLKQNRKCIVHKRDDSYRIITEKNELMLSSKKLESFFKERFENQKVTLSKFVNSVTKTNNPFHCCIHLEKDGNGNWTIVHKYIWVGLGKSIFSNHSEGGISKINTFLKVNYPSKNKKINLGLNNLSLELAKKIDNIVKGELMVLGLEIGIDSNGDLYIFNVNNSPYESPQTEKISLMRPEYYSYRLNQIIFLESQKYRSSIESISNLEKEISHLEKENKILFKKIKDYERSTSWKITKPVRLVGRLLKK